MTGTMPRCNKADCFQNQMGKECRLLSSQIKGHECPFFKTQEQVDEERKAAHDHLVEIGRRDLIEKFEYNPSRRGVW